MPAETLGRLRQALGDHDRAVVAFSGGVDSGLLAQEHAREHLRHGGPCVRGAGQQQGRRTIGS